MKIRQTRDTTTIAQTVTFTALPEQVYEVIMDSKKHESLTGGKASISSGIGGAFTAWGEHISGFNLVLQPRAPMLGRVADGPSWIRIGPSMAL